MLSLDGRIRFALIMGAFDSTPTGSLFLGAISLCAVGPIMNATSSDSIAGFLSSVGMFYVDLKPNVFGSPADRGYHVDFI